MLAFVSSISNSDEQSVLTPVQLMWINLFQDTLAALALATDRPQPSVLNRKPEPRMAPLINIQMWKTIIGQSVYQLAVTYVLYFAGPRIFPYKTKVEIQQVETLVFNTYVWMQIFNMYKYVCSPVGGEMDELEQLPDIVRAVADSTTIPLISSKACSKIGCSWPSAAP
jgi:P-type Ca2+ transporter type 2C